ncbi:MAG: alkaline phosphatase family protein [Methanohalobium sp.]|uniref:alkaline phosphatase family protein n=1 Tax=Methanohalobium sp. TaxID=2837493 RepID=UPI0039784478
MADIKTEYGKYNVTQIFAHMNLNTECSLVDIAPTISEILHINMVKPHGHVLNQITEYARENKTRKVILIIVDSLGYALYQRLTESMPNLQKIANSGMVFKCKSPADHTTPAIASIFTGYYPEEHHLYYTDDIYKERAKDEYNPKIKTIMEWGHDSGLKSGIVIESLGAESLAGRIYGTFGIPDSDDIIEYDKKVAENTVKALKSNPDIIAVHIRAIDRFAHMSDTWDDIKYSAGSVDENIGTIYSHTRDDSLFIICGDHPIHSGKKWLEMTGKNDAENYHNRYVALIVGSKK